MKYLHFRNGDAIPAFGIGTWRTTTDEVYDSVYEALKTGYRHIDSAFLYQNEQQTGHAIRDAIDNGIVSREELFVTSKLWNSFHHPDDVEEGFRLSLENLQLDYIDLYLIHWPVVFKKGVLMPSGPDDLIPIEEIPLEKTWLAMQKLKEQGLAKHLGVSNFSITKIQGLIDKTGIVPEMNQVEIQPYFQQKELLEYCNKNGILMTAFYPLGGPTIIRSDKNLFVHPVVTGIAEKHNATPAQILLAWGMKRGYAVIPKSIRPERIKENFESMGISPDEDDMQRMSDLDSGMRISVAAYSIFEGGYYTLENIFD
jgi:alcohol dehydrogenase (NADP+)